MADQPVYVSSFTSGATAIGIAAEQIGTTNYQVVKLAAGPGLTTHLPADPTLGLGVYFPQTPQVAISSMPSVGISGSVQVSGTVSISNLTTVVSGAVSLSGTGLVSVVPGVSVSIQQGVSVVAQVSGTITVSNLPGSTTGSSGMSGVLVWLGASQSVLIGGQSVTIQQGASVSAVVSGTVSLVTVSTIGTLLGTVAVNVVAGGAAPGTTVTGQTSLTAQLVWLAPTQTMGVVSTIGTVLGTVAVSGPISISGIAGVTTAASVSVTGLPVWLNPTQGVNVSTVSGTVNVNVVAGGAAPGTTVTGQTSLTAQLVWLAQTQTLSVVSTVATVLGTVNVNVVAGGAAPGTTVTGQTSLTAQLVWLAPTQTLSVVSTVATILGTQVVTIAQTSVIASIQNVVPVTTAASVSVTGLPVWLNPTQGINVSTVSGTVNVNVVAGGAAPGTTVTGQTSLTAQLVWLAQTQTLSVVSTVATVLGTVNVNVVAGGAAPGTTVTGQTSLTAQLVWLAQTQTLGVVSTVATLLGTVNVTIAQTSVIASIQNVVPVTTAASVSVTGLPVWLNPTQGVNVSTVSGTVNVNVVAGGAAPGTTATGQTSLTAQLVWLAQTQTLSVVSTVATVLGTVNVTIAQTSVIASIQNVVPVTTAASVSVTGLPVWLNPTQGVNVSTVSGTINILGSVNVINAISGTVAISGTAIVSVVPGVSVVASISGVVPVTTAASVSVTGLPVWLNPTQTIAVSGAVSAVTTQTAVTGAGVWLAPTQTIGVTVSLAGGDIQAIATTTAISSSTQVMLQSVYLNSSGAPVSTLGISGWTIGAGSALVVYGLGFGWSQAAANNQATFMMMVTTSGTTLSTVSPAFAQVTFSAGVALSTVISSGFVPGTFHGLNSSITAMSFPWVIQGPAIVGFGVAATSSGATVYATVNAEVVNTVPYTQFVTVVGTANVNNVLESIYTTGLSSGNTGIGVWPGTPSYIPFQMQVSATAGISAGTTYLMTIWTGLTQAVAGATQYAVPSGKTLRLLNMQAALVSSAVVGGTVQFMVVAATASASITSGSIATIGHPLMLQMAIPSGSTTVGSILDAAADIGPGVTIGVFVNMATSCTVGNMVVQGYLF